MRLPRIAAIALLGTAATAASAANAFADDCHHPRVGHIKATPKVVWSGHNVKLSTKSCEEGPAKATVRISGVRHTVWLKHNHHWGLSGWLHVPSTARTQNVTVWGHCVDGPALKGAFAIKHPAPKPKPVVHHRSRHWGHEAGHHWGHHHMCGCGHEWNHSDWMKHHSEAKDSGWMKHHSEKKDSGWMKHHSEKKDSGWMKHHADPHHGSKMKHSEWKHA
jgi:hypothetical protein